MTRDEILDMPAGREMDIQVGYIVYPDAKKLGFIICPRYSTDIAAAWEVVEKLDDHLHLEEQKPNWIAMFFESNIDSGVDWLLKSKREWISAPTAPLAICRAALLAVMEN